MMMIKAVNSGNWKPRPVQVTWLWLGSTQESMVAAAASSHRDVCKIPAVAKSLRSSPTLNLLERQSKLPIQLSSVSNSSKCNFLCKYFNGRGIFFCGRHFDQCKFSTPGHFQLFTANELIKQIFSKA